MTASATTSARSGRNHPAMGSPVARSEAADPPRRRVSIAVEGAIVVAAFTALTALLFWPGFRDPARTFILSAGEHYRWDMHLAVWILAWGFHALTTDPAHLFDANIFHPAPGSLAGAEHMLGHQVLFAPTYALTGNPVLGTQVNILLTFALSGAAMYALLRHWRMPPAAAFLGGFVWAFCPARYYRVFMVQLVAGQYLPLAVLFLDRTLREARWRMAALLALAFALQMLSSFYVGYMTASALGVYTVAALVVGGPRPTPRGLWLALLAAALAGAVVLASAVPYLERASHGTLIDRAVSTPLSWYAVPGWRTYLAPLWAPGPSRFHYYVGLLPLALALLALVPGGGAGGRAVRAGLVAIVLISHALALGPGMTSGAWDRASPYGFALAWVPGFSFMRMPSRFALGVSFGVAALAGLGAGRLLRTGWARAHPRFSLAATAAAVVVIIVDYGIGAGRFVTAPVRTGPDAPPIYHVLAALPPGPVLEIPTSRQTLLLESEYTLQSTVHWKPLLNGYSGHTPPSALLVTAVAQRLPDPGAITLLARMTGLRYIAVHRTRMLPRHAARWQQPAGLRRIGEYQGDLLFEIPDDGAADLEPRLLGMGDSPETILGTPVALLPAAERRAAITLSGPRPFRAHQSLWAMIEVAVENRSTRVWPGLTLGDGAVVWAARWETPEGTVVIEDRNVAALAADLAPGESLQTMIPVHVPHGDGTFRLVIGLAQGDEWFPDVLRIEPIEVGRVRRPPATPAPSG